MVQARCLRPHRFESYTPGVVLEIIKFGHPVLREKGKRVERVTPEIRQLATDMIETMHAAEGVGLAAQQIGRALMFTVIDVSDSKLPSELFVDGQPQDVAALMPLVLVNPVLSHPEGEQIGSEGCLSVPEISAEIRRAARVTVQARNLDGQDITFECTGLLARAAQHEIDHLNGILFVDRMDAATRVSLSGQLKRIQKETLDAMPKPVRARRVLAAR